MLIQPAVLLAKIQVELQREAIGVLTLSKFLAEETLSSHMLLAARLAVVLSVVVFFFGVCSRGCDGRVRDIYGKPDIKGLLSTSIMGVSEHE